MTKAIDDATATLITRARGSKPDDIAMLIAIGPMIAATTAEFITWTSTIVIATSAAAIATGPYEPKVAAT